MMLRNSKSLTEFAKEHRTLFEKICDVVEEFIKKIRGAISSLYGESTALHDEARFMELYADELQTVFDKVLSDALNASEATVDHNLQSNANKKTADDGGRVQRSVAESYSKYDKPITADDVEILRSIIAAYDGKRVSINDFTSEDIQKAQKWAYKFYKELGVKSPFFRAWFGDWRVYDDKTKVYFVDIKKDNRGSVVNDYTGWDIQTSKKVHKETSHHSGSPEVTAVKYLPYIDDITKKAVLFDSIISDKDNENSLMFHTMYA